MIAVIILLVIHVLDLGFAMAKHGEPKCDTYNFWASLIATGVMLVLYYYAGLFNNFK